MTKEKRTELLAEVERQLESEMRLLTEIVEGDAGVGIDDVVYSFLCRLVQHI